MCQVCNKGFVTGSRLKKHAEVHKDNIQKTGEKLNQKKVEELNQHSECDAEFTTALKQKNILIVTRA